MTAAENPAVAYGGNGGIGGIGGVGGSATAVATASAASGDVTASALAVGGNGGAGIYYHGLGDGGDASAMSTATSGDVSVYSTAWAGGSLAGGAFLGGFFSGGEGGYAYAFSAAFPYGDVANAQGDIVFGIATVDGDEFSSTVSFEIGGYRGDLFDDGFDLGPTPSDGLIMLYGPGTFVLSGVVPELSTWALMLLGFAGLGFAGYRASRRSDGRHPFASARMTSLKLSPGPRRALSRAALMSRKPLVNRLAPVVDAGRARLGAIGECHQQVGQLGVAMLLEELCHGVATAPGARAADDRQRRPANIRQSKRAISGHP